ncbi:MAG: hypothetical protein HY080_09100 [Gammaproteobacteria bacterium]|nr:hypothetical protein [Gammaproteobacteria bacterium]
MKKVLTLAAITTLVSACAFFEPENIHSKADADNAIAAAEHEASRADKLGFLWRDVDEMIKKAKTAAKDEKFDDAVKLANVAKKQSQLGIEQAQEQKNAAPNL